MAARQKAAAEAAARIREEIERFVSDCVATCGSRRPSCATRCWKAFGPAKPACIRRPLIGWFGS